MGNRIIRAIAIAAAMMLPVVAAQAQQAQQADRPARVSGHPNFNGIWQAMNTAYWNLEGHSVESYPKEFWQLGAIGTIPAGKSVVKEGTIPYLPAALNNRNASR